MVSDRRSHSRQATERRNLERRTHGVWAEGDRERFIAEVRDARRDARAVTIQAGRTLSSPEDAVHLLNAWRRLTAFVTLVDQPGAPAEVIALVREFVEAALSDLNRVANQMSPDQLAEANRAPTAWFPNLQEERWRPRL